jgi:hypothetical protein
VLVKFVARIWSSPLPMHVWTSRIVLAMVLVSMSPVSQACSCFPVSSIEEYSASEAVFIGLVVSQERRASSVTVGVHRMAAALRELFGGRPYERWEDYTIDTKMIVERGFKGVQRRQISVASGPGTCQFFFDVGRRYLVFASLENVNKGLATGSCTRTAEISKATETLKMLNATLP